jgi:hypothetical protein
LHFSDLDKSDKSFQIAARSTALLLRKDRLLFEKVMDSIVQSKTGRHFYFELFPDYEILCEFQYKGYLKYLDIEQSYEGKIFGNCILFLKYFFENDEKMMRLLWEKISTIYTQRKPLHPFVLGRYFQIQLISTYRFKKENFEVILKKIYALEKLQPRNGKNLFREFPGFHYFVCDGLWHTESYLDLYKMSQIALKEFPKHKEFKWKGYYDQLRLYQALALAKMDKKRESRKLVSKINTENFYFISKKYFEELFGILKKLVAD